MTIYTKIKTWIWLNIILKYWGNYIQDEINDSHEDHTYNNEWNYEDLD